MPKPQSRAACGKRLAEVMSETRAEVERRGKLDVLRSAAGPDPFVGNLSQVGLALRFDVAASTIRRRGELVTGFVSSAEGVWRETWKRTKQSNGWLCYDRVRVEGHPRLREPCPHQIIFKAAMRRGKPELIFVAVLDQHGREMRDDELGWLADGDHEALELQP
ncbi:hypothetical protein [Bradyrhizobium sp. 153]|uniref:hypothetical protein n=1 Tax=Bradyrhizobium sp. 153 TaxID=2782627 RepID=UPI001FF94393|nr:hypothetical protein [Bradyrhizobium sp. 153]MCK1668679.1 hypothetical protein [Bradyrhizobium sp. 153]